MTKGWINKLRAIAIGTPFALSVGCTLQDKEATSQEKVQK